MVFEVKRKKRYEGAEKFIIKMKEV